jgi:dynamin family protein
MDCESEDLFTSLIPNQPSFMLLGDKSSGKSTIVQNLVETLIGHSYPPLSEPTTCMTVYAMRPSKDKLSRVYITPEDETAEEEAKALDDFIEEEDGHEALFEFIEKAFAQVQAFASDTTKLSPHMIIACMTGPDLPCLNIIDLPGLARMPNQHRTKEDIENMNWLLSDSAKYLLPVVVVAGNTDYSQGEALEMAREHDPERKRTIGLITKPDLAEAVGLVGQFADLMDGWDTENDLPLGWILAPNLRNIGKKSDEDRELSYWEASEWKQELGSSRKYGIRPLIEALSSQVCRYYADEMPGKLAGIEAALEGASEEDADRMRKVLEGSRKFLELMKESEVSY